MQADDAVHVGVAHHASLDHRIGAAHLLLSMLEGKLDPPSKLIAAGRQHLGQRESDGDMGIVAAGVHYARRLRAILDVVLFSHGQRVDIGSDQQRRPVLRAGSRAGEQADDTLTTDAFGHLQPGLAQGGSDRRGGLVLLKREFRMHMVVTAARDHRWHAAGDVIVQVVVGWGDCGGCGGCGVHRLLLLYGMKQTVPGHK